MMFIPPLFHFILMLMTRQSILVSPKDTAQKLTTGIINSLSLDSFLEWGQKILSHAVPSNQECFFFM